MTWGVRTWGAAEVDQLRADLAVAEVEITRLRGEVAHVQAEATTAHASVVRGDRSMWRHKAAEDCAKAECARLGQTVALVRRLAVAAVADPSALLAFAESVVLATDTAAVAGPLGSGNEKTKGES